MRVGVFIPKSSGMLHDLVVRHLASQSDIEVVVLQPEPGSAGRRPLAAASCNVVIFAPSADGPHGIHDLCTCVGQSCVELSDNGRAAIAWTISAERKAISVSTSKSLVEAVRHAGAKARAI